MNLKEYQTFNKKEPLSLTQTKNCLYHGLIAEIGELAAIITKHYSNHLSDAARDILMLGKLGDISCLLAKIANYTRLGLIDNGRISKNDWKVYEQLFQVAIDFNSYVLTEESLTTAISAVSTLADNCGYTLEEVLERNKQKLSIRQLLTA